MDSEKYKNKRLIAWYTHTHTHRKWYQKCRRACIFGYNFPQIMADVYDCPFNHAVPYHKRSCFFVENKSARVM